MKTRIILTTLVLFVIAIVFSIYISNRRKEPQFVIGELPTSKPHEHVAPDGTIIEHRHTYAEPELSESTVKPNQVSDTKHPIQRAWERLDLETIRRKYQPYTVAEMQEMWAESYRGSFGPNYPHELDEPYPQEEWLQRNLELGQPFRNESDYDTVLQRRIYMVDHQGRWRAADQEQKAFMRKALDLPPDIDNWNEYEDAYHKFYIVASNAELQAEEADPNILGGTTSTDGTFIPFKENTVYVHVNPENGLSKFTGAELNGKEAGELTMYGITPEGITVIYTDEGGKPLPTDTPIPRFYERRMAELEEAQAHLQQQIGDHELLLELDTLLNPPEEKKQIAAVPHEHTHEHDHDHTHETPQTPEALPSQQPDAKQTPPQRKLPPELRTPDAVSRWFTELEALHGGQLPKDLKELRKIITELEKIRREGEAKLKPPQRPEHPAPDTAPPEGGSDAPPDKED